MPTYTYLAEECGKTKEVFHSMDEINNLSEETVEKLRCEGCNCTKFKKQLDTPSLLGFHHGTSHKLDGAELGNARRASFGKKRANDDFKKNVLPTISDPVEKTYHEDRLKE